MQELNPWAVTRPDNAPSGAEVIDESKARELTPISAFRAVDTQSSSVDFTPRPAPDAEEDRDEDPKVPAPVTSSAPDNASSSSEGSIENSSQTNGTELLTHPSDLPANPEDPASVEKETKLEANLPLLPLS